MVKDHACRSVTAVNTYMEGGCNTFFRLNRFAYISSGDNSDSAKS